MQGGFSFLLIAVIDCRSKRRAMWQSRSFIGAFFLGVCMLSTATKVSGQIQGIWQPVPKDDLALKDNPASPGSSAMILERQVYTDDEKRARTEFVRIKIFTEAGRACKRGDSLPCKEHFC
jgi:hypothetical protein